MSAVGSRRRIAMELAAGTLLLLLPALINGYPLVYPDTGAYLRQAIELHGAPDRPPYYSLLIFPMHLKLSLWPVIAMQSLAIATALRVMVYSTIPGARGLHYLIVTAVLTASTSVGWHADQIMPDAFTGLLAIVVFVIAMGVERPGPAGACLGDHFKSGSSAHLVKGIRSCAVTAWRQVPSRRVQHADS
jgi:hypothetical protein